MWPQWTNMLSAWQWAILLAVPLSIIALYFLKLKRRPVEVPSTYLWRKTIEDLHVNSFWQRLRQSILLLLQLLLLAAVILALLRPSWQGTQLVGSRFILLIDNSASMSATDVMPSRLDEAKRLARELIDQMQSGDLAMIVSFSQRARIEQSFTDDRNELRRRIDSIRPTRHGTSLDEALKLARGLAMSRRGTTAEDTPSPSPDEASATLYLFSDGRFADVPDAEIEGLDPIFIPIGQPEPDNLGMVALGAAMSGLGTQQTQIIARVENFGFETKEVGLELYLDDQLLDADRISLPAGESRGVEFNLTAPGRAVIELRLAQPDQLTADDRAWAVLNPPSGQCAAGHGGQCPLGVGLADRRCAGVDRLDGTIARLSHHARVSPSGSRRKLGLNHL